MDLNLQFPAGWEQARQIKYSQGFISPAPRDFVGYGPLTEPESLAVYKFTLEHNFRLVTSFHTQGKVIYWQFQNFLPEDSFNSSFAGYKDWFILFYNKPGYTIECGLGENPLPISQFDEIYSDILGIFVLGAILA